MKNDPEAAAISHIFEQFPMPAAIFPSFAVLWFHVSLFSFKMHSAVKVVKFAFSNYDTE